MSNVLSVSAKELMYRIDGDKIGIHINRVSSTPITDAVISVNVNIGIGIKFEPVGFKCSQMSRKDIRGS